MARHPVLSPPDVNGWIAPLKISLVPQSAISMRHSSLTVGCWMLCFMRERGREREREREREHIETYRPNFGDWFSMLITWLRIARQSRWQRQNEPIRKLHCLCSPPLSSGAPSSPMEMQLPFDRWGCRKKNFTPHFTPKTERIEGGRRWVGGRKEGRREGWMEREKKSVILTRYFIRLSSYEIWPGKQRLAGLQCENNNSVSVKHFDIQFFCSQWPVN